MTAGGGTVPTADWCPFNFFRTSNDIRANYASVLTNLATTQQFAVANLSRPGCWGYPDMLEVGVGDNMCVVVASILNLCLRTSFQDRRRDALALCRVGHRVVAADAVDGRE